MLLRIFTEPQRGASYDDLLRVARATEDAGFDAFFRSDHYLAFGDADGLPGPTDAFITLAGLARETSRIRLGTLVSPVTFRSPGPLAISVAQIDAMSSGRIDLGMGGGWFAAEHAAYGLPFPPVAERFDRLEEQLEIITGLWTTPLGQMYDFHGRYYDVTDSPGLPKPVQQPHPHLIVGGVGPRRTPALVARFADEYNVSFRDVPIAQQAFERARAACERIGRDPGSVIRSVAQVLCCGRDDAELARRAATIGREAGKPRPDELSGTPNQLVDRLGRFAEIGVSRVYLQMLDLADLDHLELVASQVAPQVAAL
ncbi:MAG: LLM class F420-dependent oxidoreductase [Actinomycetota bacterium]|nr:MAG: LLM class F420-dependent oxidoreductase [Actinomycetota bacterium]